MDRKDFKIFVEGIDSIYYDLQDEGFNCVEDKDEADVIVRRNGELYDSFWAFSTSKYSPTSREETILRVINLFHKYQIVFERKTLNAPIEETQPKVGIDWNNLQSENKSNRHIVTEVFHHFSMPDNMIGVNLFDAWNTLYGGTFSFVKINFPEWEGQKEFYAFMWMNPDATDNFLKKMIRHRAFSIRIADESTMCLPVLIDYPTRGVVFIAIKGLMIEYYNFYDPNNDTLPKWMETSLIECQTTEGTK